MLWSVETDQQRCKNESTCSNHERHGSILSCSTLGTGRWDVDSTDSTTIAHEIQVDVLFDESKLIKVRV